LGSSQEREGLVLKPTSELIGADQVLPSNERSVSLIIDTIPAIVWSARPDGYCDFLNQRWLDYAGMTAPQAAGWGWEKAIHPDDRKGLVEYWQSCLASGLPGEIEARMRRFDGAYRWFLFRANPLRDASGQIVRWYGANVDIEDRKRGEEALRASELSWRQIVDNIPGFVATMTAMGEVEFLNQQTLDYFGKTTEELKNWALIDAVHPDDLPRVIESRIQSIERGEIYEIEHRCRRADGVYRWFQVRGLPVRSIEGTVTAWYLLLTDIEDLKKAEEALQSSERHLSLTLSTIPALIQVSQPDGTVLWVSQAVLDYHGITLQDVQQDGFRSRYYHPDDVERLGEQRKEALTRPLQFEYEQRALAKDGTYRWFLVRYNPLLDDEGRITRWYTTAVDIEDRKRAEAELERAYLRLAEAQTLSKTGSFITDVLANEHNWSDELYRIFELDPATRITHEVIRTAFHPEDLPIYEAAFQHAVHGQNQEITFRIITPAGNVKHVHAVSHMVEKVAGRPVFIGAVQDVTPSKVAEEALNRARSELAHMARVTTLSALTASIGHEVNQPIAAVITSADACLRWLNREQPDVRRAREAVMRIQEDGNRAAEIISHLKSFYRKDVSPRRELVSANEVVREMLVLLRSEADRHALVMRTDLAEDLPLVRADRVQLQQVLMNLMLNGMEASREPGGELTIRTRSDRGAVLVSVSDAGEGIPADRMEQIFNAFFTTKAGGTGMGLAISRSIIDSYGGRLWATANPKRGSTFHFTLPADHEA
jgi:PAS domain S-box-containing protein